MHLIMCTLCLCVCVCVTEANASAQSLPMRSVSDDQLLSHSEAFASSTSSLPCDSHDFQNLTKSDDIEIPQRPTCNHDVPENCTSSCWTFADCTGSTGQRMMPDDGSDKTERCSPVTRQLSLSKSKSNDDCRLLGDVTDPSTVNQPTCFQPATW